MEKSDKDSPLKKSVQSEITTYQNILNKASKIVEIIPRIQEMKDEAEAKLDAINELPDDILEEITPRLLVDQNWHYESLRRLDRSIPIIDPKVVDYSTSSGSTASISAIVTEAYPQFEYRPIWANHVIDRLSEIADIKAKRNSLPQAISALSVDLGVEFIQAEESFQKTKAGIIQPHQAASSMRNIIQQVWGEFVKRARINPSGKPLEKRYELKKASHRAEINKSLASGEDQLRLEYCFDMLYGVYQDLSGLSKRTATSPIKMLHDLRTRWILTLDSLRPFFPKDFIRVAQHSVQPTAE